MDIFPTTLSMQIKFCRYCFHDSDWHETKTKVDYTVWNLYAGSLTLEINGKTLHAGAGDVLFFHPGDTYSARCDGECCDFLVTFFSFDAGNSLDLFRSSNSAGIYSFQELREASDALCDTFLKSYQDVAGTPIGVYSAFLSFLTALFPYFGMQTCFYDDVKPIPSLKLHKLIAYMEEHVENSLSVRELAEMMDMSEKYFIRFFHAHTGYSPKQYMIRQRMNHSVDLMKDASLNISDIAMRLHFSDEYAFSKAFKKFYGESPAHFRKHFLLQ